MKKKPGHERIKDNIENLANQTWLTESQKFWPRHLFHFTNIDNAKSILSDGSLFPREKLKSAGKLRTDIANQEIINATQSKWKNFVRLYFRPRTPMQYRNEGIRPKDKTDSAHCPVPIVFVFNSWKILSLHSTQFSNGNLRSKDVEVDNTIEFYLSLPFEEIYHDTFLSEDEKKRIKFHRHAEVIVPDELELSSLQFIYCRSQAEFETLINLLPSEVRSKWQKIIGIDKRSLFFFRKWLFIEKVALSSSNIVFYFNTIFHSYPFHANLIIKELETNKKYSWEDKEFKAEEKLEFDLKNIENPKDYEISFSLDNHLVYRNMHRENNKIFF